MARGRQQQSPRTQNLAEELRDAAALLQLFISIYYVAVFFYSVFAKELYSIEHTDASRHRTRYSMTAVVTLRVPDGNHPF